MPDFDIERHISKSIVTIKADAVRNAFNALGEDIVWAVMDSGVDKEHPHFQKHSNLELPAELAHADFAKTDGPIAFCAQIGGTRKTPKRKTQIPFRLLTA